MLKGLQDWDYVRTVQDAMSSMGAEEPDLMVAARIGSAILRLNRAVVPDDYQFVEFSLEPHQWRAMATCDANEKRVLYTVYLPSLCAAVARNARCNGSFKRNHVQIEREIVATAVHEVRHRLQSHPRFSGTRWFRYSRRRPRTGFATYDRITNDWRKAHAKWRKQLRTQGETRERIYTQTGSNEFDARVVEWMYLKFSDYIKTMDEVVALVKANDVA